MAAVDELTIALLTSQDINALIDLLGATAIQLEIEQRAHRVWERLAIAESEENVQLKASVDNLTRLLARQAVANAELAERVAWYRIMYYGSDTKRAELKAQHRLNGES